MSSIISLPLTNQLTNGTTADGGQVLADLNAVASQVNANAAKNGVNNDITQLLALTSVPANVTAAGWTLTSATINTPTLSGGTITGSAIDSTTTGVTQAAGDNTTKLATTAYVVSYAAPLVSPALTGTPTAPTAAFGTNTTQVATTAFVATQSFSTALPNQSGNAGKYVTTNGTVASWSSLVMPRSARTSNTILASADSGKLIDITSGTFSQTFDTGANLGAGWYVVLRNSGSGDITPTPGSGTIDGLSSFVMYPGEARLVQCDGTNLTTVVLAPFYRAFTASGTFTRPPGYSQFGGIAWSAGMSGQRTNNAAAFSQGGNAGGAFPFSFTSAQIGTSQTITVGAGGVAVSGVADGNSGGDTTIGALLTVKGATRSAGGAVSGFAGAGTSAGVGFESGINNSAYSAVGVWGGATSAGGNFAGGSSVYGGAGGGNVNASGVVYAAGTSVFGGNGGAASIASNGTDGVAPGGGGGATQTGAASGAGARGEVRIWGVV